MSIYHTEDYRHAIKLLFAEAKEAGKDLSYTGLANHVGAQKALISKVLAESAHLSDDHVFLLKSYFSLAPHEARYFELIFQYTRSGLDTRRKSLLKDIREIQENSRSAKFHLKTQFTNPEKEAELARYYLDPLNLIVHMFLAIDRFAAKPELIAFELSISESRLETILATLKSCQIIDWSSTPKGGRVGGVKVLREDLHMERESIFSQPHQILFRLLSAEKISRLEPGKRFVFNATFVTDATGKAKLQEEFLKFANVAKLSLSETKAEGVYQMSFDLFSWSEK